MKRSVLKTLVEVQDWFQDRKEVLAFDWETTGLNYLKMQPVGVSFYDGENACYIDLWENSELDGILRLLYDVFQSGTFIAHNLVFDLKCCRRFYNKSTEDREFRLGNNCSVFDTYIAAFLLDENRSSHSLKVLVVEDLGVSEDEVLKWETADQSGRHSETFYNYAMNDAIWTYQLYKLYKPQLIEQELWYVFSEIEMPFIHVIVEMESNGILVDKIKLLEIQNRTQKKLLDLEDEMFGSVGMRITEQNLLFSQDVERFHPTNLRSPKKLVKIIEKKCRVQVPITAKYDKNTKQRKWGKYLNKQTLFKLKGKHKFIDCLIEYRKYRKLYDSYIIPAWGQIDEDCRLRPNFGIVRTGRTRCSGPNLQQLPRITDETINYRSIIKACGSGSLIGADYSGQELRGLGEVSQDENILRAFDNNYDLHLFTANRIFNLRLEDSDFVESLPGYERIKKKYAKERYKAKNGANFPIIYGTTYHGVSNRMGVPIEEAKRWIESFFDLYPGVKAAMDATKIELKQKGYVTTLFGRRRRFPNYDNASPYDKAKMVRQAFNFKIQGLGADQIKIAAAKALRNGLRIILIVHDEIIIESSNKQDARILKDCMINAISLSVPFKVDVKIGQRYSEIK